MRFTLAAAAAGLLALSVASCGDSSASGHGAMTNPAASASAAPTPGMSEMSEMPGMDHEMPLGDGLSSSAAGYTLKSAGAAAKGLTFTIVDDQRKPVTAFEQDQTKLMHFYLIRSDLTGFQHVHPTMSGDGTWTAPIAKLQPGAWRMYASFIPSGMTTPMVLGEKLTVDGAATDKPLPEPATSADVDGYTVTVSGDPMAGMAHSLGVTITKDGRPATDLEPYLGTAAHLTAIHEGDLAFAHLHPEETEGADLSVDAMLPKAGNWRLFIQFQSGGTLHTAAMTMAVM